MLVQWQRKSAPREIICRLLREKNILYLVDLLLITPLHQVMIFDIILSKLVTIQMPIVLDEHLRKNRVMATKDD